jgi:cyclophilin family peptidyl-prolyl cis-trans isomerase
MKKSFARNLTLIPVITCIASLEAAPPAAPTDFIFTKSTANDWATFEWVDNSTDETFFQFEITEGEGVPRLLRGPGTDASTYTFRGFTPGSGVTFRLRAAKPLEGGGADEFEFSEWTSAVEVITKNLNFLASAVTGTPGESLSSMIEKDFEAESFDLIDDLPDWLSFDATTLTFSADNPPAGSFRVSFEATVGIHERSAFLYFNIINDSPVVLGSPDPLTLTDEPPVEVDLSAVFDDPDFIRAAAISTDFGDIKVGFYDGFPITVGNFFAYIESDAWDGSFFHRLAKLSNGENFVLQGGGFRPDSDPGTYTRVTQFPAIVNEFDSSRPNLAGTISMAKLVGDPDSATNQFFISLNDNRDILDEQNEGFTVFGRAADIAPANRMSVLERDNFTVDLDGLQRRLDDWPLKMIDENSPSFDQLASMNDVFEIPTLEYSFSFDGDDIVSAEVAPTLDAPLIITRNGTAGTTLLTITATDLDGSSVSATLPITVTISYALWAERESASGPDESSDSGSLTNFEEYAYGGDPNDATDDPILVPSGGIDPEGYGVITFRHRDFSPDISYTVQTSPDLVNWNPVWTTSDGFDDANVSGVIDEGEIKVLSIRSNNLIADQSKLFFRMVLNFEDPN